MKLPKLPDLSVFEEIAKSKPIHLVPGDRFIAQVDSVVSMTNIHNTLGTLLLALIEYLPCVFEATEQALALSLTPQTEETKAEVLETIELYRKARELFIKTANSEETKS